MDESKVKSPWKPVKLAPFVVVLSISVVVTGSIITVLLGTEGSKKSFGSETVIGKVPPPTGKWGTGSGG